MAGGQQGLAFCTAGTLHRWTRKCPLVSAPVKCAFAHLEPDEGVEQGDQDGHPARPLHHRQPAVGLQAEGPVDGDEDGCQEEGNHGHHQRDGGARRTAWQGTWGGGSEVTELPRELTRLVCVPDPRAGLPSPCTPAPAPRPHLFLLKCHQKLGLRVSRMDSWMKQVMPRYMHATVWPCTEMGGAWMASAGAPSAGG